jgi:uncharacterized delta-60 repeat protein
MMRVGQFFALPSSIESSTEVLMKFVANPIESLESRTLLSAGQLDLTFSGDGRFTAAIAGNITITDGTAQSDGKTLVAGTIDGSSGKDLFVARVTADGALDTSFSGDGIATVSIGTADALDASLAIDSSGRIIVAGGTQNSFSVLRLLSNGDLDSSFSGDGITTLSTPGYSIDDVAIQSDGKIVGLARGRLFRLTTTVDLDTTYGEDGYASPPGPVFATALSIGRATRQSSSVLDMRPAERHGMRSPASTTTAQSTPRSPTIRRWGRTPRAGPDMRSLPAMTITVSAMSRSVRTVRSTRLVSPAVNHHCSPSRNLRPMANSNGAITAITTRTGPARARRSCCSPTAKSSWALRPSRW